ncbi:hypothetical protein [Gordonia alkanivorans]|uniref:hypothetical protein n=1 Tax=Gordonia alkanivorans TaxID=84096 RepID=UPI0012DE9A50|nr:hypothetical protein [Gordonia alkanivorans]
MSMVVLVRKACAHYNTMNPTKRPADPASAAADPLFIARISVNYLRHETTRYDRSRDSLQRLTTSSAVRTQVGEVIKGRTLAAIAAAYPHLAAEARRQAQRTDRLTDERRRR